MIFITLGNQNFPFDRLLGKVEKAIKEGVIKEEVFVQTGYTVFKSDLFRTVEFLGKKEFNDKIAESSFVISHAGTGSIISCLKKKKKVIVAARLSKFNEHIDNHQLEILNAFGQKEMIVTLNAELSDFNEKVSSIIKVKLNDFESNNDMFNKKLLEIIEKL